MKIATSFLAGWVLMGSLGAMNSALAADGIISKDKLTAGSYCHEKFPAIREDTLGTDHPELKSADSGDIIDFYGPCDENPLGKDQIHEEELEEQHQWEMD